VAEKGTFIMPIPITKPYFDKNETAELKRVLESGWVMQGPKVEKFESIFARYVGTKYAIAASSGTTALHLALLAAGIGEGDEVITCAFSFIATANSIRYSGAHPVFCDIDIETYNLDPEKVLHFIDSGCTWNKRSKVLKNKRTGRKVKAIMPVDQVGLPADLDKIKTIAKKYRLQLIEDGACALGSRYKGKRIGKIADITCFSFHPRKIITTAEGGMITTDDAKAKEIMLQLRSHGQAKDGRYPLQGYNYRMSDLHASLGIAQMKKLNRILSARRYLAKRYDNYLAGIDIIRLPHIPQYATPNYQSYTIRILYKAQILRSRIIGELAKIGITAKEGITAIHKEPYYRKLLGNIKLPLTEEANRSTLMIPLYPSLKKTEQNRIIKAIRTVCKKHS